ncbi:hypothetical protein F5Y15DRAFT_72569 [Xylariaceae sp. FL0016]|nr:hypothetical protein F5Y15DRAFT_72569 [Xylariaceae sp. FL0016]
MNNQFDLPSLLSTSLHFLSRSLLTRWTPCQLGRTFLASLSSSGLAAISSASSASEGPDSGWRIAVNGKAVPLSSPQAPAPYDWRPGNTAELWARPYLFWTHDPSYLFLTDRRGCWILTVPSLKQRHYATAGASGTTYCQTSRLCQHGCVDLGLRLSRSTIPWPPTWHLYLSGSIRTVYHLRAHTGTCGYRPLLQQFAQSCYVQPAGLRTITRSWLWLCETKFCIAGIVSVAVMS